MLCVSVWWSIVMCGGGVLTLNGCGGDDDSAGSAVLVGVFIMHVLLHSRVC